MNITLTRRGNPIEVAARRTRNDQFRRTLTGGSLMLSAGIIALGAANQARIIAAVRGFTGFDDDCEIGNPFDDHSIGDLEVEVDEPGIHRWPELIFFSVNAFGHAAAGTSTTRTAENGTALVLTIMLASEW